jgi:hypothetical protein
VLLRRDQDGGRREATSGSGEAKETHSKSALHLTTGTRFSSKPQSLAYASSSTLSPRLGTKRLTLLAHSADCASIIHRRGACRVLDTC